MAAPWVDLLLQEVIRMAYEKRETGNLIGSDKVEGTAVYGADISALARSNG